MTHEEALEIVETITDFYNNYEISEKKVTILLSLLQRMDYQRVMGKLFAYVVENPYPPSLAEIAAYQPDENTHLAMVKQWEIEAALVPEETKRHFSEQMSRLLQGVTPT